MLFALCANELTVKSKLEKHNSNKNTSVFTLVFSVTHEAE